MENEEKKKKERKINRYLLKKSHIHKDQINMKPNYNHGNRIT